MGRSFLFLSQAFQELRRHRIGENAEDRGGSPEDGVFFEKTAKNSSPAPGELHPIC